MGFSDNLQKLMDDANVNTVTLGKALDVSDESVSNWKKGKSLPKLDVAMRIAKFFGITLGELVGENQNNSVEIRIPVLGDVSAGSMDLSTLLTGNYLTIFLDDLDGYPREECYALAVNGRSMEPEFPDGFYIIVHQQKHCSDGDYVIVLDETTGENTFKQFRRHENYIELSPLNKEYSSIIFRKQDINRLIVQGVVINKIIPV